MLKDLHEENRRSWNKATIAQNSHRGDQVKFFQEGGNTLYQEEKDLLEDIKGLKVAHLQCNSGQDTLSLAQMGADVVGVDISDTAIEIACTLSNDSGVPAAFQRMDIYDWLEEATRTSHQFDIVFCSYGTICWLSNLDLWAKGIFAVLKPGGRFIVVDYHPMALAFDEDLKLMFPYFTEGDEGKVVTWENGVGDFVAQTGYGLPGKPYVEGVTNFKNPHSAHEFHWGLAQIVTALLGAGLTLTTLKEYPFSNGYKPFYEMRYSCSRWYLPEGKPTIPLMYAIVANRCG